MKKLRVGVIYGGRSGEHEVSVASAAAIFKHLDPRKYEAVPIRIEKSGRWALGDKPPQALSAGDVIRQQQAEALQPVEPSAAVTATGLDVVFPVLHGPYGEDGTVQGLLELANVPYVGAGVLGSATGMDKSVMKTLFLAAGLPVGPYVTVLARQWAHEAADIAATVEKSLGYPVFVKPANLGSSVGISKARSRPEFDAAMALALQFDRKIVIEAAIPDAREIECAVLGNDEPEASVPGEVIPTKEFYDYEAKYLGGGSKEVIPAALSPSQAAEVQRLAIKAFQACDCAGMARVDFLMPKGSGELYLNELNTIPGFTANSMYPKMWEASGVSYAALLDRLITLAIERHAEKQQLRTSIT